MKRRIGGLPGAALASGALFAFAFPPSSGLLPGFLALVALTLCLNKAPSAKTAFWVGYAFGAGQFLINFFWIANAFAIREGFSYGQGMAAVAALALAMALYPAAATSAAFYSAQLARNAATAVLFLPLTWLLAEYARGFFFTGFPWNPIGAMWGSWLPIAQLASVIGVYGLSAMTLLVAAIFAKALTAAPAQRKRTIGLGVVLSLAIYGGGATLLPGTIQPTFSSLDLVLVQANIAQRDKWKSVLLRDHVRTHVALTNSVPIDPQTQRVVIWPEAAYPYVIDTDPAAQQDLQSALGETTTLIFGANRFVNDPEGRTARNALFILHEGQIIEHYDKVQLVPFGEYLPLASVLRQLGLRTFVDALSGFKKGDGFRVIGAPNIPKFSPLICYEGIFSRTLLNTGERPDWILNISNDAWFGESSGPAQHLNLVRFRAIENGVSVVRATGTGITAIIDPYGRVTARIAPFSKNVLHTQLPQPRMSAPVFPSVGTLIPWATILLICALILAARHLKHH
ncbi:MAG: apolipoprotein N-acyltransferase [Pseudomonadota bacterium]